MLLKLNGEFFQPMKRAVFSGRMIFPKIESELAASATVDWQTSVGILVNGLFFARSHDAAKAIDKRPKQFHKANKYWFS